MLYILLQNQKMEADYCAGQITPSLISICYPKGRRFRQRKCVVHFDNALIHNSKVVLGKLVEGELKRMRNSAYNHDPSPCDLFLFDYLKDKLIDRQYATPEKRFCEVETIISEVPNDRISRVFVT
jgi:hypothetical protein